MKKTALTLALIIVLGLTGCTAGEGSEPEEAPMTEATTTETTPATEATTTAPVTTIETEAATVTEETENGNVVVKGVNTDSLNIIKEYEAPTIGEEAVKALTEWRKNNSIHDETAAYCTIGDYTVFSEYPTEEGAFLPMIPCPYIAVAGNGKVTEIDAYDLHYSNMNLYCIKDNVLYYYAEGLSLGWEHFFFAEFSLEDGSKINEFYETYPLGAGERDDYVNTYQDIKDLKDLEAYAYGISKDWYRIKRSDVLYDDIK